MDLGVPEGPVWQAGPPPEVLLGGGEPLWGAGAWGLLVPGACPPRALLSSFASSFTPCRPCGRGPPLHRPRQWPADRDLESAGLQASVAFLPMSRWSQEGVLVACAAGGANRAAVPGTVRRTGAMSGNGRPQRAGLSPRDRPAWASALPSAVILGFPSPLLSAWTGACPSQLGLARPHRGCGWELHAGPGLCPSLEGSPGHSQRQGAGDREPLGAPAWGLVSRKEKGNSGGQRGARVSCRPFPLPADRPWSQRGASLPPGKSLCRCIMGGN